MEQGTARHCLEICRAQAALWRFHVLKSSGCEEFRSLGGVSICSVTAVPQTAVPLGIQCDQGVLDLFQDRAGAAASS